MKSKFTLLFFSFSFLLFAQTPSLQWNMTLGSTSLDDVKDIAIDNSNNVYMVGNFSQPIDFDTDTSVFNLMPSQTGVTNVFISKYTQNKDFVFAISIGGTSFTEVSEIELDSERNIYVVGKFQGTCDFDPSANVINAVSNGSYDIFVAKYNSNGSLAWVKTIGAIAKAFFNRFAE